MIERPLTRVRFAITVNTFHNTDTASDTSALQQIVRKRHQGSSSRLQMLLLLGLHLASFTFVSLEVSALKCWWYQRPCRIWSGPTESEANQTKSEANQHRIRNRPEPNPKRTKTKSEANRNRIRSLRSYCETICWGHVWEHCFRVLVEAIVCDYFLRPLLWDHVSRPCSETSFWDYLLIPSRRTMFWDQLVRPCVETISWEGNFLTDFQE